VLYPGLENSDLAFPRLAFELLPVGLRGLMLAALAAAILSSLEAMLNAASTLFTMDFLRSWRPDSSDEQLVKAGRVMTLVFMVVAALWAPVIYRFETLWHYLQSSLSYLTPPVVCVFLFGAFSHRVSATAAVCTLAVGVPAGAVAWLLVEVFEWVRVQYLYACGGAFVANALLLWGISLASPPVGEAASEGLVWTSEDWRRENRHLAEQPAWSHFRYQSLALSLLTVAIVVWWW
jgi:SSS family solute:Na+ symporter